MQSAAQAIDDIGAANTNLQAATQWLGEAAQKHAEDFGEDNEQAGQIMAAKEAADEAQAAVAAAGTALEAFKEALEAIS